MSAADLCRWRTAAGTCSHVDLASGFALPLIEASCLRCIAGHPDEDTRGASEDVKHYIGVAAAKKRKERIAARQARSGTVAKPTGKPRPLAPVVPDPQSRLEICEACPKWRAAEGGAPKCRAFCSCKDEDRANPLADDGEDCPRRLWRRG